jgi:hypothetical protein
VGQADHERTFDTLDIGPRADKSAREAPALTRGEAPKTPAIASRNGASNGTNGDRKLAGAGCQPQISAIFSVDCNKSAKRLLTRIGVLHIGHLTAAGRHTGSCSGRKKLGCPASPGKRG